MIYDFVKDRQMDRQTDRRKGKTICFPTLAGGDIKRNCVSFFLFWVLLRATYVFGLVVKSFDTYHSSYLRVLC